MIVMTCIDDNGGTMFNHRRQSRDRVLCAEILHRVGNQPLKLAPASAGLFSAEAQSHLDICENVLSSAGQGDFCFVEGEPLLPWESQIEQLVLYRWNRVYPADMHLDLSLSEHGWTLTESRDFVGSSHDKITEEVYVK